MIKAHQERTEAHAKGYALRIWKGSQKLDVLSNKLAELNRLPEHLEERKFQEGQDVVVRRGMIRKIWS